MTSMMMPVYMSKDDLLAVLDDVRAQVAADDSFEGSLSYEFPWHTEMGDPADDPTGPGFRVRASYRIGNSMGQGGMRIAGEMREIESDGTESP